METLGVVGASFRNASALVLAQWTVPKEERPRKLGELARAIDVEEILYLATCNRVEIAFRGDRTTSVAEYRRRVFGALTGRTPEPGEAERTLRAWVGEGAAEHLFLVTAGLDSADVGEREIRSQVREALAMAREAGVSGTLLDQVLTEALRVAASIHRQAGPPPERASLADIALEHLLDRLHRTPGRVALIGVSPMTRQCGLRLTARGHPPLVVNRTAEPAEALARELAGESRSLDRFRAWPDDVEALLVATGSPETLLGRPELERLAARASSGEPPLIVDMSVPSNIDRDAARAVGARVVGMDDILTEAGVDREERLAELAPARQLVDERLARLRRDLAERSLSPVIAHLHRRYRETAVEGVERLFRKELRGLGEPEREAVLRWAEMLARRFAHVPVKGLRELAAECGAPAVETFLSASDRDYLPGSATVLRRLRDLSEKDG